MKLNIDFNKILNKILTFLLKFRNKYFPNPEITEYDLDEIAEAFEDYIGLVISNFTSYHEDIENIEDEVFGRILTSVESENDKIYMQLSDLSGNAVGRIILIPTMTGQFIETDNESWIPIWATRYKISFVGGARIEYLDTASTGKVLYQKGQN